MDLFAPATSERSRDQGPGPSRVQKDEYRCPVCDLKYSTLSNQVRHLKAKHADQSDRFVKSAATPFVCDLCACEAFTIRYELMQHHQNHHGFVPRISMHEFGTFEGEFEVLIDFCACLIYVQYFVRVAHYVSIIIRSGQSHFLMI